MSGGLPTALAVAGTALMAVAIFGPFRKPVVVEDDTDADVARDAAVAAAPEIAQWPALVAVTAVALDARARIDLTDALGALQSAWAESVLRQAYETEADPAVRSAIASALSSNQSLVT